MRKIEKITRIAYIVLCILSIGSIFYELMVLFMDTPAYGFFRSLNLSFSMPMFFMRLAYLQYIIFGILTVLSVLIYIKKIRNNIVTKKLLCLDILLWLIILIELIFTEEYFLNILYF